MDWDMFRREFRKGDWVVYRKLKFTTHPGNRAHGVEASVHGDDYSYFVDKYWIVAEVLVDHKLLLKTRRKKTHIVDDSDLNLRRASMWDRLWYRRRFIDLQRLTSD
jgi:hypothetical protein